MAKTNNPLFYFGSVGSLSTLAGLLLAGYVAIEWFVRGISHEVLAVVAGVGILFGVQLLMFGVLSDMIVALNREQTRQIEQLAAELSESEIASVEEERDDESPDPAESTTGNVKN